MIQQLENLFNSGIITLEDFNVPDLKNIIAAIVIFLIGRWLAKRSRRWFRSVMNKTDAHLSKKVMYALERIIYYTILIIAISFSLVALGLPAGSLVIIFGFAVILVAIALQTVLNNLAATIIFIVFQTYKPGDWVDVLDGTFGQVKEIQMFDTVIVTQDKKTVTVPNGVVMQSNIINYSELGYRRVDITVTITYDSDLVKAKQIMEQILAENEHVLDEPVAVVGVELLGTRGIDFSLRPFAPTDVYFDTLFDVTEQVKLRLTEAGITIAVLQQEMKVIQENVDSA